MKTISPESLVPMDQFAGGHALRVELAYARGDNLLFGQAIYRPGARLWLHKSLADVVLAAARLCFERHKLSFVLYDGLRTTDAQEEMLMTKRVKDNPHWLQEPRLLSPPGTGGHPRGMAIDLALEDARGNLIDMGTPFDFLARDSGPQKNPAHREYVGMREEVKKNRAMLTDAMMDAAKKFNTPLLPLPQEWWDFRLPSSIYEEFAPLSDSDLPREIRMVR